MPHFAWLAQSRARVMALSITGLFVLGCARSAVPSISNITATDNPLNVLSAIVKFDAPGADSARVVYTTPGDTDSITPYVPVADGAGRVVLVGLLPFSTYLLTVQVQRGHRQASATWGYATGGLPPRVQAASLVSTAPFSRGLTLVSPLLDSASPSAIQHGHHALAVAFDALGRVRWYRMFDVPASVDLRQQPNGHFTIALPVSGWKTGASSLDAVAPSGASVAGDDSATLDGFEHAPTKWAEFLPSGEIVHTYTAGAGETTGPQVLLMTGPAADPVLHLFGYTTRPLDAGPTGDHRSTTGVSHQIVRESAAGVIQFKWDAWDHYGPADWTETAALSDFDHPNSLDFDLDGNYIASFPNMDAIVKVNAQTGAIMWQFGGRRNQFAIHNDPWGPFAGQYAVRVLQNGNLLIFDSGLHRIPRVPRAVEYALDVTHRVATKVWEYSPEPRLFTSSLASVQRLSNGNTLLGFGSAGVIEEVDPAGKTIAKATFAYDLRPSFYRAIRIASLYEYERP